MKRKNTLLLKLLLILTLVSSIARCAIPILTGGQDETPIAEPNEA